MAFVPLYNILVLGSRGAQPAHRFRDSGFSTIPQEPASVTVIVLCVRRIAKQSYYIVSTIRLRAAQ
jgi:hypothetical protein